MGHRTLPLMLRLIACCLLGWATVAGATSVKVLALFPGKAMLEIDGQRKVLAVGKSGPGGVRLIEADPGRALVEINGERRELRLGSSVSARYAPPERREIRILKDRRGGYFVDGLINGQGVRFLVDTGATSVAMSESQAERLGLQHRVEGRLIGVGTASGNAVGHELKLNSVSVEGVQLRDVRAVVISGNGPRHVLLGMNVLSRFDIDQRENLLILRTKF